MIIGTMPRQVEYALMILLEMQRANPGRLFSARELSDQHGAPFDVISKVMQRLGRAGILRSVQGKHGGYQLNQDLSAVSLLELMAAVLGEVAVVNCLKPGGSCPRSETCTISESMRRVDLKLRELYSGLLLGDLFSAQ